MGRIDKFGCFLSIVLLFTACGDGGAAERAEKAFLDSLAQVKQVQTADSIAMVEAMHVDTSIETLHARYLDFEDEVDLRIVVKDDSGNMRKFPIAPSVQTVEWQAIQKPANRGEWMLLHFKERELAPPTDSLPGEYVTEVVEMKMLGK